MYILIWRDNDRFHFKKIITIPTKSVLKNLFAW